MFSIKPMVKRLALVATLAAALGTSAYAEDLAKIKIGALKFGTVNWLLETIKNNDLAKKNGVDLEIVELSGKDASQVALQGKAVDIVVTDWLWVTRLRSEGTPYTFAPYSNAVGSLMMNPKVGAKSIADLQGKKIGVAGGAVDKSWLLMRAYSQKEIGKDLKDVVEPQFGAPPLLNELALKGDLDGVITFWNYAAPLKAAGFDTMMPLPEVLKALGVNRPLPLIGWVFDEKWADANKTAVQSFLKATEEAQQILLSSDEEWTKLRPMMKAEEDKLFTELRDLYRAGIPKCFGKAEQEASAKAFTLLAGLGGSELVGEAKELAAGTFWSGVADKPCP
ncbi:MAG: ABC transporter substrate-binding protein [Thiofilum sp.]|uniref:ABC transporter substrate-binding protein n=1 Tax=Thiofilum sp. TaxID=2212733 RepID=UPI0025E0F985|nr:ABC transporter substrate-binding protein [Thiofilum sp.]MBK8453095.1 ABC transporter substrate-binding protein [Thiofilum sp.]